MFFSFTCSSEQQTQLHAPGAEAQQPGAGVNQKVIGKSQHLPVSYESVLRKGMTDFSSKTFWLTA